MSNGNLLSSFSNAVCIIYTSSPYLHEKISFIFTRQISYTKTVTSTTTNTNSISIFSQKNTINDVHPNLLAMLSHPSASAAIRFGH